MLLYVHRDSWDTKGREPQVHLLFDIAPELPSPLNVSRNIKDTILWATSSKVGVLPDKAR